MDVVPAVVFRTESLFRRRKDPSGFPVPDFAGVAGVFVDVPIGVFAEAPTLPVVFVDLTVVPAEAVVEVGVAFPVGVVVFAAALARAAFAAAAAATAAVAAPTAAPDGTGPDGVEVALTVVVGVEFTRGAATEVGDSGGSGSTSYVVQAL
ncbi:MAG: hypothetical protein Q4C47_00965 [Planctomycetia bacterium]|nr:hypothetical protein [Planctomycetia bacterium]